MEKAKTNPFVVTLLLITLVIAGGGLAFGFMKKSEFTKKNRTYKALSSDLGKMESMEGYPNQENVNKLKDSLISYKGKIEGLRNALKSSTMPTFKQIPSSAFANHLVKTSEGIEELYKEKGIALPENWYLGFEKYRTVPAPKVATGVLDYELGAIEWLHRTLAEHSPSELRNFFRKSVKEEINAGEDTRKKGRGKQQQPYSVSMPIQMTFLAYEEDARKFLNALVRSNDYLFTIDSVKLKLVPLESNVEEESDSSTKELQTTDESFDAIFEVEEAEEDGGMNMPEKATLSDEKLFNQVLGQEEVAVFIDMNLVYIQKQEDLPEIKK